MVRKIVLRVLAFFALLTLVGVLVGGYVAYRVLFTVPSLPAAIVLTFDLDQSMAEKPPDQGLAAVLGRGALNVRDVIDALDRGARDGRVKGAVVRLGGDSFGFAQVQEVRAALARFRAAGKFAVAYADTFGEFQPGNKSYYLASGCEQIWLQPIGLVGLTGLAVEMPFARRLLDELRIVPQVGHREEYKSALEALTEAAMSAPHREMLASLLDDLSDQLVADLAVARKLEPATVRALMDQGPLLDREALAARLVDRIGYYDELVEEALGRAGADGAEASLLEPDEYLAAAGEPNDSGPTVALIFAVGGIARGEGGSSPTMGGSAIGAQSLVDAFQEAIDDDDVRAILLRIDSPGGSAVASETIRRAVVRARAAGKPVVVSMASTAASGGYWIAMNADRIIAEPATLTGSIGVIVGKVASAGLWDRIGVTWDRVKRGANAGIWSAIEPFTVSERARVEAVLDDIYGAFMRNVAEARHLPPERVRELARGRVWTGRQAVALGLVDELGDLNLALQRVREAIGLAADAPVSLDVYPQGGSRLERIVELLSQTRSSMSALAETLEFAAQMVRGHSQTVRMPDVSVR